MTDITHAWYDDPANVSVLLEHLAKVGFEPADIAYAQTKPWKYEDEYLDACAYIEDQHAIDDHEE